MLPARYPAWFAVLPKLLGVAAIYALLAEIVLTYFSANGVVSIIWPPSGLALAVLLMGGKRYFPGVFLGAFLANTMTGLAPGVAAAIAVGNTLEALLGAWLLTRYGKFDPNLRTLRDYLRLVGLAGFVACSVAALNGSTTLLVSGFLNAETYFQNLLQWWMGDTLGVIMITPLILAWRRIPDDWLEPKRIAEAILLLGLTFLVGQIVFLGWFHRADGVFEQVAKGYWMFLFITLVAIRLGIRGVLTALIVAAIQALSGAAMGVGFFADDIAQTGLINYWFYIVTLSVVGMALATHFTERKQLERQLSLRLRHRDVMERITRISLGSTGIEELLGKVLDEMLDIFKADRVWFLYPCDPGAASWSVPMERARPEWPGAFARGMVIPMTPEVAEVFREVLASKNPLPYGPAASRTVPAVVAEEFSVQSQILMALRPRVGSAWVIGLHHCAHAHTYDKDELKIFKDTGRRVADALSSMIVLKELRESENRYRLLVESSPFCIHEIDLQGCFLSMNKAGLNMLGLDDADAIRGMPYLGAVSQQDASRIGALLQDAITNGIASHFEFTAAGDVPAYFKSCFIPIKDANGKVLKLMGITEDITERKRAEEQIHNLAFYDALTQLPNRRLLLDRLGQARSASKRSGHYAALMFIDLDKFKPLNDEYGHDAGDLLLVEVARRIGTCVREVDTVARFGGDEFIVMLAELSADKDASALQAGAVAEKIRSVLAEPYVLTMLQEGGLEPRHIEHRCTSSIGVVLFANHEASQDDLIKWADMAMYRAKEAGRNRVHFFEP